MHCVALRCEAPYSNCHTAAWCAAQARLSTTNDHHWRGNPSMAGPMATLSEPPEPTRVRRPAVPALTTLFGSTQRARLTDSMQIVFHDRSTRRLLDATKATWPLRSCGFESMNTQAALDGSESHLAIVNAGISGPDAAGDQAARRSRIGGLQNRIDEVAGGNDGGSLGRILEKKSVSGNEAGPLLACEQAPQVTVARVRRTARRSRLAQ